MKEATSGVYLERIQIDGLWGKYDVDWRLHPDVNILVGENGTGKSTILLLAASGLNDSFMIQKEVIVNRVIITVNGKEYGFKELLAAYLRSGHLRYFLGGTKPDAVNMNYINTFDFISLMAESDDAGTSKTNLDQQLEIATRQFLDYQVKRSNEVFTKQKTFEQAFAMKSYLFDTINRLFAPTGKKVDKRASELEFTLDDTERIQRQDLSAGEKQLLILLLTALCQNEKPAILILDEPEISLHLRWQYELIEILRTLNPNGQLVIATHSPSIFNDGWRDKVFWTEDIVQKAVPV